MSAPVHGFVMRHSRLTSHQSWPSTIRPRDLDGGAERDRHMGTGSSHRDATYIRWLFEGVLVNSFGRSSDSWPAMQSFRMPFATLKIPRWSHGLLRSFRVMSMLPAFGPPVATYGMPHAAQRSPVTIDSGRNQRNLSSSSGSRSSTPASRRCVIRQAPRIEGVGSCAICETVSLPHNAHNHRVAASDVDFRFGPDGNSGALYCYATCLPFRTRPRSGISVRRQV